MFIDSNRNSVIDVDIPRRVSVGGTVQCPLSVNEELKAAAWCKQKVIFSTSPSCFFVLLGVVLCHCEFAVHNYFTASQVDLLMKTNSSLIANASELTYS